MASIDLKDAFYSVLVHKNHQAYLIFFVEEYLKFACMLKWISAAYVDDSYLQGDDNEDCFSYVLNTIEILRSLGFTIHSENFIFIPTQWITYLGFI